MKKILFALSAIAALAISSCSREEVANDNENDIIYAAIDAPATRTALEAAGDHYNINWVVNDQITVSNGSKTAIYKASTGGSTVAEFKKATWGTFTGDSFIGYYPSGLVNGFLPYEQTYAAGDEFKVPMISDETPDVKNLKFRPITGVIKLNVTTSVADVKVKSIKLKADQGFSGSFTLRDGAAIVNDAAGTLLACGDGVAISSAAISFYIAAPANAYSNLEITVFTTDGLVSVAKLPAGQTFTVLNGQLREINVSANNFVTGTNGGEALLCYGAEFNEYLKQLAVSKKFGYQEDSLITKVTFKVNDNTVGTVKINDQESEIPIYASINGTEVTVTTPASVIRTGTSSAYLFSGMTKLKSVENLNVIDTRDNEDFSAMFNKCYALESVDLSNFVTDKSISFAYMFCNCQNLKTIDVSKFKTGNSLSFGFMFQHCHSVETLDVKNFDTSKCTDMDNMFDDCWVLKSLDLSTWNTDKVRKTRSMFNRCKAIKELDIRQMSFPSTTLMTYMFYQMLSLEVLHMDGMDFSRWTSDANQTYMFNYIPKLKELYLGEKGYNKTSYAISYFFCSNTQAKGIRTASESGSLTIHCSQAGADWLSKTNLRWINSGYKDKTPIPVKFLDYKTAEELTTTWGAN